MEIISDEGYRLDGRKACELRNTILRHCNIDNKVCLELEQGSTKVVSLVSGIKGKAKTKNKLNISTAFLDVAREEKRKSVEKICEIEKVVTDVFLKILIMPTNSSLDIDVTIKQDDGSLLTAIVNCISLNLCYSGVPMKDTVVATTVGFVSNTFFVDICGVEENHKYPYMSLILMIHSKKLAYLHMFGKIEPEGFEDMFRHGYEASNRLFSEFSLFLRQT